MLRGKVAAEMQRGPQHVTASRFKSELRVALEARTGMDQIDFATAADMLEQRGW
jgi:hypothetical protein